MSSVNPSLVAGGDGSSGNLFITGLVWNCFRLACLIRAFALILHDEGPDTQGLGFSLRLINSGNSLLIAESNIGL